MNNNIQHLLIADTMALKGINGTYGKYSWDRDLNVWELVEKTYEEYDANSNLTLIRKIDNNNISNREDQFTYDDKNRLTSFLTKYKLTGQTELMNYSVEYYQYNDNNDKTFSLFSFWDKYKNEWRDSTRIINTYDSKYRITSIRQEVFLNGAWTFSYGINYIRTFQNDLLINELCVRTRVDLIMGGIIRIDTSASLSYTYNSNNNVNTYLYEYKLYSTSKDFDIADKYEYFYGTNNHLNRVVHSSKINNIWRNRFEVDSIVWLTTPRDYLEADFSDFRVYIYRLWDTNTSKFEDKFKVITEIIYPPMSTEKIEMEKINGRWDTTFIKTELYDEQKNLVLKTAHIISNEGQKKLYVGQRNLYTYAGQNKIQDHVKQIYIYHSDSNYVNDYRKVLLVASGFASTALNDQVKIFPNPSSTHFLIDFKTALKENTPLRIYNLSSQLIQYHLIDKNTTSFNIENLEPGIYIVRIEEYSFKIVKK